MDTNTNFVQIVDPNAEPVEITVTCTNAYYDDNGIFHTDTWSDKYIYPHPDDSRGTPDQDTDDRRIERDV